MLCSLKTCSKSFEAARLEAVPSGSPRFSASIAAGSAGHPPIP
jgi:hypothetical protein